MATLTFQHRWLGTVVLPVDAIRSIDTPSGVEFDADMNGYCKIVPVGPIKVTLHDGTVIAVELPDSSAPWCVLNDGETIKA